MWAVVRATRPESQPGPSGLRAEHLTGAAARNAAIRLSFATLIDNIVAGRLKGHLLTDSTLSMLPKGPGKFRPIGIGETYRRIAARLVGLDLATRLRPTLEATSQFGISHAGTARAHLRVRDALAEGHILQMDIKNAFNAIRRSAV